MRKRNCRIELYFTKEELEVLTKKVRKTNLSREGFCRRALKDIQIKEAPPADLPGLIREIRHVGSSLDQLLKCGRCSFLDAAQLREALVRNRAMERLVMETYTTRTD